MKRIILLASALALGGVAYAQDTTQPPTTPDASATQPAPDASTPPAAPDASGSPTTPDASGAMPAQGTDTSGAMQAPTGTDSSMGTPPAATGTMGGAPSGTATGPSGPVSLTPTQGPTDLPMCSKTVTDNCKQAHNGGGTAHKATHHRRKK